MSEQIDLRVCYAYSRSQSEERKACKAVLGEILSGLMAGRKSEFSAFSGKIHSSDISDADFIAGDPSHNELQAGENLPRPVPAVLILPSDNWGRDINSVLKNPAFDVAGVFRMNKLSGESRDSEDFGELAGVVKNLLRQVLRRRAGLHEEDLSKPVDWKVKLEPDCGTEFVSVFSTPAMQKMARQYKDALLDLDTPELRDLRKRAKSFSSKSLESRCNSLREYSLTRVPSLLLLGETGCGKTLLASAAANVIMPNTPLTKINIAAYNSDSIDAMLFGAKEGSFTSSIEDMMGMFIGHCGEVVFLDEIGDMDAESQTRLLTYMDNAHVLPRGMTESVCAPCILIAATNKDVKNDSSFRKDILNRFDHVIEIPALRARTKDLRLLISMLLQDKRINPGKVERISLDAVERIESRDFPGNFRELRFCISQAVNKAYSEGSRIICVRHLV